MKPKIIYLLFILTLVWVNCMRAEIVLDVSFDHLVWDNDGLTSDGQLALDTSGNHYHGFLGGGSGGIIITGPTGTSALDTTENDVYIILRDDRTYTNHGEASIPDPFTTPTPYFALEAGTSYTLEAILNWQGNTGPDTNHGIMGQTGAIEWWVRENKGKLEYVFDDGPNRVTSYGTIDISNQITNNDWHHLAIVLDRGANTIRTYFDYALVDTNTDATIASLETVGDPAADIRLGGYNTTSSVRFDGLHDHYRITSEALAPDRFLPIRQAAYHPVPEHGTIDVPEEGIVLNWSAGEDPNGANPPDVTGLNVYLGTDPANMALINSSPLAPATAQITTGALLKDALYYWRVDTLLSDGGVVTGYSWQFKTELSLAQVDSSYPVDFWASENADASFTVMAVDPLGGTLKYQWFYDPNTLSTGDETILIDGDDYSGAKTDTLTVLSATVLDEGSYYCEVSNASGKPVASNPARLIIKQLVGHWPFDGNANDIAGNNTGIVEGTPDWQTGLVGSGCAAFDGPPDGIHMKTDALNSDNWTISIWEYSLTSVINNGYIIASGNPTGNESLYLRRSSDGANYTSSLGSFGPVVRDQWHLNTIVYDINTRVYTWYLDGEPLASITGGFAGFDTWLYVGGLKVHPDGDESGYFVGRFDDLRLYNYAMDAYEVAELYTDVMSDQVICVANPQGDISGPEGTPDCIVDLYDIAALSGNWLGCNLYPTCLNSMD